MWIQYFPSGRWASTPSRVLIFPISLTSVHSPESIYSHFAGLSPPQSSTIFSRLLLLNWSQKPSKPLDLLTYFVSASNLPSKNQQFDFRGQSSTLSFCGVSLLTFNFLKYAFPATTSNFCLTFSLTFSSQDQRLILVTSRKTSWFYQNGSPRIHHRWSKHPFPAFVSPKLSGSSKSRFPIYSPRIYCSTKYWIT